MGFDRRTLLTGLAAATGTPGEVASVQAKPTGTTKQRLTTMDELSVDMHVLSLTSPGVQMFDTGRAVSMAELANDRLAEIVRARPRH